jgi:hypothetical protein
LGTQAWISESKINNQADKAMTQADNKERRRQEKEISVSKPKAHGEKRGKNTEQSSRAWQQHQDEKIMHRNASTQNK